MLFLVFKIFILFLFFSYFIIDFFVVFVQIWLSFDSYCLSLQLVHICVNISNFLVF